MPAMSAPIGNTPYWGYVVAGANGVLYTGGIGSFNGLYTTPSTTVGSSYFGGNQANQPSAPRVTVYAITAAQGSNYAAGNARWWAQFRAQSAPAGSGGSGTFDGNGVPIVAGSGKPANDQGQGVDPLRYQRSDVITNTGTRPLRFQQTILDSNGNPISTREITVQPGESTTLTIQQGQPFTTKYTEVTSDPDSPDTTYNPRPDLGGQSSAMGTGDTIAAGGTGKQSETSTDTGGTPPPAATDQTRPGTTETNADARNKELRLEIQRVVSQLVANNNAAKANANQTNTLLDKIANKPNPSGGGSTDMTATNGKLDTLHNDLVGMNGTGSQAVTQPAIPASWSDVPSLLSAVAEDAQGMGLGFGGGGLESGDNLTWDMSVMDHSYTLNVSGMWGASVANVRAAILGIASIFCMISAVRVVRSAFGSEA